MRKLFYNGDILTMESPRPVEAVLTEGERILAVGELQALSRFAGRQAEIIDLEGGALLPGFVDCYGDAVAVARRLLCEERGEAAGGRHSLRAWKRALCRAEEMYAARGITVRHGANMTAEGVRALSHAATCLPIMSVADVADYEDVKRAAVGRGEIRLCGMSLSLDVTDDGGVAVGERAYSDRAVNQALRMAMAEGVSLTVRAMSEATVAQFLRVVRAMAAVRPEVIAARHVLLDARLLSPTEVEQVRQLGIVPCFAADVIPRLGDDLMAVHGMAYAARLVPLGSAHRAEVIYTLGEGAGRHACVPDPIFLLCAAVERLSARGIVLGGYERASVYEALRAMTWHGAWRYHAEREWGSIRAGARANLVRLDRSPLGLPTRELHTLRPVETFVDGRSVWRADNTILALGNSECQVFTDCSQNHV